MKQAVLVLVFSLAFQVGARAQLFAKERVLNDEHFDKKRTSWGFFLGLNSYDFKFEYEQPDQEILVTESTGFNVGLLGNLRLNDYFDLRLEPGLYFTRRDLLFPGDFATEEAATREVSSNYIHVPLLLKFSTKRLNNFKPFVVGGMSFSTNLSSNEENPDDNSAGQFRMTSLTYYYELGIGIDLYLPYFKFTPSLRGVFALSDELVRDKDPNSPYTSNITSMQSRGIFINFTFQ
ncbi:MAG: porin family protein [Leeuwenhoekiella sp.]